MFTKKIITHRSLDWLFSVVKIYCKVVNFEYLTTENTESTEGLQKEISFFMKAFHVFLIPLCALCASVVDAENKIFTKK